MHIDENISLKEYNTFGIEANASFFIAIDTVSQLQQALQWANTKGIATLVLGGGSNVLFTKNFNGLVIKNNITGIEKVREDNAYVYVKAGAGVGWHQFVLYCLQNNWAGVENLALIPGCVGASPMQNIGAYGVEIKEVVDTLNAIHVVELYNQQFNNADCEFGYRESVFKHKYKNQFVITDVTYRLRKQPIFHTEYGAIRQELEMMGVTDISIQAVADAVIHIRSAKLPDPKVIGNAGSFFKNPSIAPREFQKLQQEFPGIVAYPNSDGSVKLAAGWMIEQCGFKGMRRGEAGVHSKQALVLVNYGNATGAEILSICHDIKAAVLDKFGVTIVPEVNIL